MATEINGSTLKRFLKKTGCRAKPESVEVFGIKVAAYADKLATSAAAKATEARRKTMFPEDFEESEPETTVPTAIDDSNDSEESEESEDAQ